MQTQMLYPESFHVGDVVRWRGDQDGGAPVNLGHVSGTWDDGTVMVDWDDGTVTVDWDCAALLEPMARRLVR